METAETYIIFLRAICLLYLGLGESPIVFREIAASFADIVIPMCI